MSWFGCQVVPVKLVPHPNADSLSLVNIETPFIATLVVRTQDWLDKDKGVFIPPDAVVPNTPEFSFLNGKNRIKATKLRGIVSTGLLIPANPNWEVGQDVKDELGITKYEEPVERLALAGDIEKSPHGEVKYTDIENIKRYPNIFVEDELVVLTEKTHGACSRFLFQDNRLHCGSRTRWLKEGDNVWWKTAFKSSLPEILPRFENKIFFGEVYGAVQDINYGHKKGDTSFILFDIYDIPTNRYLNFNEFQEVSDKTRLNTVPIIYQGPWLGFNEMYKFTEGPSLIDQSTLFKEGWVAKPKIERYSSEIGRVILKAISEKYLCRKDK